MPNCQPGLNGSSPPPGAVIHRPRPTQAQSAVCGRMSQHTVALFIAGGRCPHGGVCVCNLSSHLLTACAGQQLLGLRASFRSLCFCPQGAHTLWPWKSSLEEGTGGGLTQASPSCLSPLLHCSCLNLLFSPFFPLCSPPFAAVHAVESKWPLGAGCPPRIGGWCVDGSGSGTCPGPAPV